MSRKETVILAFLTISITISASPILANDVYVRMESAWSPNKASAFSSFDAKVSSIEPLFTNPNIPESSKLHNWVRVTLKNEVDTDSAVSQMSVSNIFEYVEKGFERHTFASSGLKRPTDPLASFQWHLEDISAYAAWDIVPDASDIIIAVPDLGVEIDHPDLADALWRNEAEISGQAGYDDDGNGYVDDFHGWDTHDDDGNVAPIETSTHGMHTAGLACASRNNDIGIAGLGSNARLMAVRIGATPSFEGESGFQGILYAALNGADVISLSWGGGSFSLLERDVVEFAVEQGAVVVAAAGNDGSTTPQYPAGYDMVIAVGATDEQGRLYFNSTRGSWVDILAPGVSIYSTVNGNSYSYLTGTSMSTPIVAGISAMIIKKFNTRNYHDIVSRLTSGSEPIQTAGQLFAKGGVVNAWRALSSDHPLFVFESLNITDSGGDGIISPGDVGSIDLIGTIYNGSALTIEIEPFLVPGSPFGSTLLEMRSRPISNESGSLTITDAATFTVSEDALRGHHPIGFAITMGEWRDTLIVQVPVDPPWVTHEAGDLEATFTDFGAIGFWDYVAEPNESSPEIPDGVHLQSLPSGFLYHGSVMVTDGDIVSDAAYGDQSSGRYDFETIPGGEIRISESDGIQISEASYSDNGFLINQKITSHLDGSSYVTIELDIIRSGESSAEANVGIYTDWDITPYFMNRAGYDAGLKLGYLAGEIGSAGISVLSDHSVSGARAINNNTYVYGGLSDSDKLDFMRGGIELSATQDEDDWSYLLAVSAGEILPCDTAHVAFALIAAENSQILVNIANEAGNAYGKRAIGNAGDPSTQPSGFAIHSAYPNPFNSQTTISIGLPSEGWLRVSIYDILGRKLFTLHDGIRQAGDHQFIWKNSEKGRKSVASGLYFVRAEWNNLILTQKLALIQ